MERWYVIEPSSIFIGQYSASETLGWLITSDACWLKRYRFVFKVILQSDVLFAAFVLQYLYILTREFFYKWYLITCSKLAKQKLYLLIKRKTGEIYKHLIQLLHVHRVEKSIPRRINDFRLDPELIAASRLSSPIFSPLILLILGWCGSDPSQRTKTKRPGINNLSPRKEQPPSSHVARCIKYEIQYKLFLVTGFPLPAHARTHGRAKRSKSRCFRERQPLSLINRGCRPDRSWNPTRPAPPR